MVFLRPTVLRNAERSDSLTADRYDYIMQQQINSKFAPTLLPDFGGPILPPRTDAVPGATNEPATAAPK